MEIAQRLFNACILLGTMLSFSLFVEWFVSTYILKRLHLGRLPMLLLGVLAVALLIFGLVRRGVPANAQQLQVDQAANAVGLVASVGVIGGFVFTYSLAFVTKKIGPLPLALVLGAFFTTGVIAYAVLRRFIPPEALGDNDIFFVCVAASLVITGLGSWLFRPLFVLPAAGIPTRYNPLADPLSFGEKRRQRLNKKRSR